MERTLTYGWITATRRYLIRTLLICIATGFSLAATAQVIVGTGTSTQRFPMSYWYGYGRSAAIYTSGELNTATSGGTITTLAWNSSIASTITGPTIIYLKAVGSTTAVASDTWDNTKLGATQVYSGTPANWAIGWNVIDITDFPVTAGQNIAVLVETNFGGGGNGTSTGTSFYYTSGGSNSFGYWQQDTDPPTSTPSLGSGRPNITFGGLVPPTCFTPSGLAASNSTLNGATLNWTAPTSGTPVSYQWEVRSSGVPGSGSPQASGTVPAGTLTANVTGLLPTSSYIAYIRSSCGGSDFSAWGSSAAFNTLPGNDMPSGAIPLTLDATCSATYSNALATLATDEPRLSCKGSQTASAQVWFSFVAPAGGFVKISTDYASTTLDTKIGLFAASNPSDLSTYNIISCDDDGGVNGNSSAIYASGLSTGTTYYVAVAHYNSTTTGSFCIDVKNVTSAMIAPAASCVATQSIASYLSTYTGWVSMIDNGGLLVANIRQNAGTATGFDCSYTAVTGTARADATGRPYLNRNYFISGANATSANLKLYFSDAEVSGLGSPLATLNVSRVEGGSCAAGFSGTATTLSQVSNSSVNGISWIEVVTPGFSNFYVMSGATPLPLQLLSFSGKNDGSRNLLSWKTASEKNFSHFELQRSADGIGFEKIAAITAGGNMYSYWDERPFEGKNFYRLNMMDKDGKGVLSDVVELYVQPGAGLSIAMHPNPVRQQLHIHVSGKQDGRGHILVTDIVGKSIRSLTLSASAIDIDMSGLAPGLYFIQYTDNSYTSITRVTKE